MPPGVADRHGARIASLAPDAFGSESSRARKAGRRTWAVSDHDQAWLCDILRRGAG